VDHDQICRNDRDDPVTGKAVRYLSGLRRCCTADDLVQLESAFPEIHGARQLYVSGGKLRAVVEARILAGQTDVEIAALTSLDPLVIGAFESLFFNVRDRLQARDWIANVVIGPGLRCGFGLDELPLLWRAFGFFAGPKILEIVMAVTLGEPLPGWLRAPAGEDQRVFEARIRWSARLAVAVRMMRSPAAAAQIKTLVRAKQRLDKEAFGADTKDRKLKAMLDCLASMDHSRRPARRKPEAKQPLKCTVSPGAGIARNGKMNDIPGLAIFSTGHRKGRNTA